VGDGGGDRVIIRINYRRERYPLAGCRVIVGYKKAPLGNTIRDQSRIIGDGCRYRGIEGGPVRAAVVDQADNMDPI
jgi:hypothetical protein